MKRSAPMKRSGPMKRKTPLRARSKKMEKAYAQPGGRRDLVRRLLKERPICEAGVKIGRETGDTLRAAGLWPWSCRDGSAPDQWVNCQVWSKDVHELLARSAGGSILDEKNCVAVCSACHAWVGDHPRLALKVGLRKSRYGRV